MMIKQYDVYGLKLSEAFHLNITSVKESIDLYYIRMFLIYSLRDASDFIRDINNYPHDRFLFELVELSIDEQNGLIYIYESCRTYDSKPKTPEIEELLEEDNFIELCKIGFLDYMIITKDNFIHLLLAWDKVVDTRQSFALLYLDDKDWYDVLSFDSQKAMEQFIADYAF